VPSSSSRQTVAETSQKLVSNRSRPHQLTPLHVVVGCLCIALQLQCTVQAVGARSHVSTCPMLPPPPASFRVAWCCSYTAGVSRMLRSSRCCQRCWSCCLVHSKGPQSSLYAQWSCSGAVLLQKVVVQGGSGKAQLSCGWPVGRTGGQGGWRGGWEGRKVTKLWIDMDRFAKEPWAG
jgi:hypothetical protein